MTSDEISLWALFVSAFVSSTLFPGGSEVLLAVLAGQHSHNQLTLLGIATLGNTLGGMTTWGLGWLMACWYPLSRLTKPRHQQAVSYLQKWGSPALLLSWVPVIGDPLCLAAGWFRINGFVALGFIGFGKALRYGVVVTLAS